MVSARPSVHSVVLELSPFEENGVSDPSRTTVSFHPFPLSRCSAGCRWMGHGWLNYAWKSSGPRGQKQAKLGSKNTVRLYDTNVLSPSQGENNSVLKKVQ